MKEKYSDGIEWNTYEKLRKERPELFAESTQIPIVTDKETVDTFVRETGQKVGVMYSSEYHYLLVDLIGIQMESYIHMKEYCRLCQVEQQWR